MEPVESSSVPPGRLPGFLAAALSRPSLERKGWQTALAPAFIGLFLWIAFFDQIPREALSKAGVIWGVLGATLGSVLAYQFLYYVPAMWGMRTGKPLAVVATSTFGVSGATYVPGLLLTLAQIVWLAVATSFATGLCLQSLVIFRLLDPIALRPGMLGNWPTPAPLFMTTSLFWAMITAMAGRYIVRVIIALMNVYPVVPAFLLGLGMVLAFKGLPEFEVPDLAQGSDAPPQLLALLTVVQMVFGFFAASGLASCNWGAVSLGPKDVKAGGWVGVAMASWVSSSLAILTVAGVPLKRLATPGIPSFHDALPLLMSPKFAAVIFLAFTLTSLAPACYAGFLFGSRMFDLQPKVSETFWTLLGVCVAWGLIVSGVLTRMFDVFSLLGACFAPAAGAMAADYVRSRGKWPGARRGVNVAGMVSWVIGVGVGLLPMIARALHLDRLENLQPAAVFGFLAAFVVYSVVALLGGEPAVDERIIREPS